MFSGLLTQQTLQPIGHGVPQGFSDQRSKPCGGQPKLLNRIEGTLGCRIKFPQFVQVLPEKFETNRQFAADREDVDNVSPPAPGAFLLNARNPLIAKLRQCFAELFKVDLISFSKRATNVLECVRWRQMGLKTALSGNNGVRC